MSFVRSVFAVLLAAGAAHAQQRLDVRVDPRIELMAVTQILADYGWTGLLANQDTAYRRDVDAWFSSFREHAAVKRFAELAKGNYRFDAPASTMVCLTALPELRLDGDPEECGAARAGGARNVLAWVDELRDFARASKFDAFFRAHAGLYRLLEEQTRKKLLKDYAAPLEAYHGVRAGSFTIVLAPLLSGNFGQRHRRRDGRFDIYGILGTDRASEGIEQFGTVESLRRLVWHEFGHSFSNPEVERLRERLSNSGKLLDPIAAKMGASAYSDWFTTAIEHVDRAIEVRLAFRELGEDEGERAIDYQKAQGFAYIEPLARRLEEYERNRDRYPTFEAFAPRLLAVFDELTASDLPPTFYDVPPTIGGGWERPLIYVIPTGETDPAAQKQIGEYVTRVRDRQAKDAEILQDKEALVRDLSSYSVQAYGTLAGNKWLAKHRGLIPAVAAFEQQTTAGPLRLVAAIPDPHSAKVLGVALTATDASAVPGIVALGHRTVAYVIGKNTEALRSGYYGRRGNVWRLK
jgi:hypothetical protein